MIVYFDTSAFVPLFIDEPSTRRCRDLWEAADAVVVTRLVFVEVSAALAQALRAGRISRSDHAEALVRMNGFWEQCHVRELDEPLMRRAASLADRFGLRGYDSVHCAAAAAISDNEVVAVSGDQALLRAWQELRLAVADPNGDVSPP